MDEARVVINIKEGVIELQGPVDFVRHYLDKYQSSIKELQELSEDKAVGPEIAKPSPRKRRGVAPVKPVRGKRGSCTKALKGYLKKGFFDEPRSIGEIKQHLTETGVDYTDGAIRATLKRLAKSGSLGTTGRRMSLRYHRPDR